MTVSHWIYKQNNLIVAGVCSQLTFPQVIETNHLSVEGAAEELNC